LYEVKSKGLDIIRELTRRVRLEPAALLEKILENIMRPDAELDRKEHEVKRVAFILKTENRKSKAYDFNPMVNELEEMATEIDHVRTIRYEARVRIEVVGVMFLIEPLLYELRMTKPKKMTTKEWDLTRDMEKLRKVSETALEPGSKLKKEESVLTQVRDSLRDLKLHERAWEVENIRQKLAVLIAGPKPDPKEAQRTEMKTIQIIERTSVLVMMQGILARTLLTDTSMYLRNWVAHLNEEKLDQARTLQFEVIEQTLSKMTIYERRPNPNPNWRLLNRP